MKVLSINPKAKGLIFDLDGTLSNSLPVHFSNWQQIGKQYGFVFDEQIMIEMTGRPTIDFAQRLVDENNLSITPAELVRMKQESFWSSVNQVKPIDLVVDLVKKNYGRLPMSVGTGASRRSADLQLKTLGLTKYFDAVVSANDVTEHKPLPETFLRCAELMGVEPALCQVFEDGDLGMDAALAAGMMLTDVRPYINYGEWALS